MTTIEFIVGLITTAIILFAIIFIPFIRVSPVNQGVHNGYVTAVEQVGYIWPNYRVYIKTDNSSSQEDKYCLDRRNTDLADKLKAASHAKQKVSVLFDGVRGFGADLCSGEQIIGVKN